MAEEIIIDEMDSDSDSDSNSEALTLAEFVERLNKFLYVDDFVTEESLSEDIARVATETGLSADAVQKVMASTLAIMEERRKAAGVDPDKIGEGWAYGGYIVRRPGLMRRGRH